MLLLLYLMLTLLVSALCSPACAATSRIRVTMVAHRYFYATESGVALLALLLSYFYISTLNYCFWSFTSSLLLLLPRYNFLFYATTSTAVVTMVALFCPGGGRGGDVWGAQTTPGVAPPPYPPPLSMSRPKEDHRLNTNVMTGLQILQRQRQGSKAGGSSEYQYVDCSI